MSIDQCTLIQIENTTACNATCNFCPVGFIQDPGRPIAPMNNDLFYKIVREGMEMGVSEFIPFLNGEPLMSRDFFLWMDYLAERNLRTALSTNGALLTKDKADRLAQYTNISQITFSFHGGNSDTYRHVMGLNFEKTRAKIEYFLSIAKVPVKIYMLKYEDTEASEQGFLETWDGQDVMVSEAYFSWGGLTQSARNKHLEQPVQPCKRLLNHMAILNTGQVALCCMDYHGAYNWGDANTEHLADIWARAQPLRERHKAMDFSMNLCDKCNMNRYGG